jgi:uncharacterized protein YbbC (DUF1343 family)
MKIKLHLFLLIAFIITACGNSNSQEKEIICQPVLLEKSLQTAAEQTDKYFHLLKGKTIAIVANQTSLIGNTHLVDSLHATGIKIKAVFAPEHGFRGEAGAGEHIKSGIDPKTKLPLVSLYGNKKKPTPEDLKGVDMVLFDIQDVGARFYTYISTLFYVMEACAENNIPLLVLDRPNPNGHYIDGPVLEKEFTSFVGIAPIPVVHGLTVGEFAQMVNGEGWLKGGKKCDLTVIPVENYSHSTRYELPVRPSPNLPDMTSIYLYLSLCFFEGTVVSVGRGTDKPFRYIGYPGSPIGEIIFSPVANQGAPNPPHENKKCRGFDVAEYVNDPALLNKIDLQWLILFYNTHKEKEKFFNNFFNTLAGNSTLHEQIINGTSEEEIRKSWQPGLEKYKEMRKKYLIYED